MPTLLLRFPAGRYHATAWGHHVNEGVIEWPPSPWRLLRALIACGHATQGWRDVPPEGRRLIEALAATPPRYRLPPASVGHSRHYMPVAEQGREVKTLVFDTWANVGDGLLAVRWDGRLDADALSLFGRLAENLSYLGRSESWVLGQAAGDDDTLPEGFDAYPHTGARPADTGWEQVALMAPVPPDEYAKWRAQSLQSRAEAPTQSGGSRKSRARRGSRGARTEAPYPPDLVACLEQDTAWWKSHGWSQPPGSQQILYWRPAHALSVSPPLRLRPAPAHERAVPAMLLALTPVAGPTSALPRRVRTLPQAELLHRALVARVGKGSDIRCPELTGKDDSGKPLAGHRHAHILPVDLDGDGHLDHVLVHAPMGLGAVAQQAIRSLRRTWTKGVVGELRSAVAAAGELDDLRRLAPPLDQGIHALLGPPGGARSWVSVTPFVPPRHLKPHGKNSLEGQISAELASRGMPQATVRVLPWNEANREMRHAVRVRRAPAPPPPIDLGFMVELTLGAPVAGPLTLGYGAHFGMGLFAARD